MNWQSHNDLKYLEVKNEGAKQAIVLFHGFGADAHDLANLSQVLTTDRPVDWYFPQGVLEVPIGPMMSGRAWFPIEERVWDPLMRGEVADTPYSETTKNTLVTVIEFLNTLGPKYDNIVIGGFSQGAILTSHCFYHLKFPPAGLALLSGFLVSPSEFPKLPEEMKVPFFQSHGEQDPVLNIKGAQKLYDTLSGLGLKGQFVSFQGGHEIPVPVLLELRNFLGEVL